MLPTARILCGLRLRLPAAAGSTVRRSRQIYLADEEETAWAEWYRVLAEIALPPTHGMPRDLWRWAIAVNDIADLSTLAKLARLDLPPLQPSRRNWLPFQAVGSSCTARAIAVCCIRAPLGRIIRRSACSERALSFRAPTPCAHQPPTATRPHRQPECALETPLGFSLVWSLRMSIWSPG